MRSVLLMLGLLGALSLSAQSATACDEQRIRDEAQGCFGNPQHDVKSLEGSADMVICAMMSPCRKRIAPCCYPCHVGGDA